MMTRILVLSLTAMSLGACVSLKTRKEIREEGGDLEKQTQTQRREEARTRKEEKAPPPAPKADDIDDQMRQLNGRVDTAENQVQQLNAAVVAEKESVTQMAKAIDQKFLNYEEAIKKLELQVATLTEQVNSMQKPAAAGGGAAAAPKGRSAYDEGEEAFAAKKWKEAIVSYQKYRDSNPKGKQYADATYKIGMCFQELKMKDEAKAFFDEVVSKYPGSKEAKKAAFRSKQLK
jgi:TolA-binding protein